MLLNDPWTEPKPPCYTVSHVETWCWEFWRHPRGTWALFMRQHQWEVSTRPAESHSPTVTADFMRRFHCCWHVQYDDLNKACVSYVAQRCVVVVLWSPTRWGSKLISIKRVCADVYAVRMRKTQLILKSNQPKDEGSRLLNDLYCGLLKTTRFPGGCFSSVLCTCWFKILPYGANEIIHQETFGVFRCLLVYRHTLLLAC